MIRKQNPFVTPKTQIQSALRQLWLRSRERACVLKRDQYTCRECNKKQTRKKGEEVYVEVHHNEGVMWDEIIKYIRENLLVDNTKLVTLCKECHKGKR